MHVVGSADCGGVGCSSAAIAIAAESDEQGVPLLQDGEVARLKGGRKLVLVVCSSDLAAMQLADLARARDLQVIARLAAGSATLPELSPVKVSAEGGPRLMCITAECVATGRFDQALLALAQSACLHSIFIDDPDSYQHHSGRQPPIAGLKSLATLSASHGVPIAVVSPFSSISRVHEIVCPLQLAHSSTAEIKTDVMDVVKRAHLCVHRKAVVHARCAHSRSARGDQGHPLFGQVVELLKTIFRQPAAPNQRAVVFMATARECEELFRALGRCRVAS